MNKEITVKVIIMLIIITPLISAIPKNYDENLEIIEKSNKTTIGLSNYQNSVESVMNMKSDENSIYYILYKIEKGIVAVESPLCRTHLNDTLDGIYKRKEWAMASEYYFIPNENFIISLEFN